MRIPAHFRPHAGGRELQGHRSRGTRFAGTAAADHSRGARRAEKDRTRPITSGCRSRGWRRLCASPQTESRKGNEGDPLAAATPRSARPLCRSGRIFRVASGCTNSPPHATSAARSKRLGSRPWEHASGLRRPTAGPSRQRPTGRPNPLETLKTAMGQGLSKVGADLGSAVTTCWL